MIHEPTPNDAPIDLPINTTDQYPGEGIEYNNTHIQDAQTLLDNVESQPTEAQSNELSKTSGETLLLAPPAPPLPYPPPPYFGISVLPLIDPPNSKSQEAEKPCEEQKENVSDQSQQERAQETAAKIHVVGLTTVVTPESSPVRPATPNLWGLASAGSALGQAVFGSLWSNSLDWEDQKYLLSLEAIKGRLQGSFQEIQEKCKSSNTELASKVPLLIQLLESSENDPCTRHQNFLLALRDALTLSLDQQEVNGADPLVDFVLNICLLRFTGWNCYSFYENLIKRFLPDLDENGKELSITDFTTIEAAPRTEKMGYFTVEFKKLLGSINVCFDPAYMGNIPHRLFSFGVGGRPITWIRTGTPTIETGLSKASINPEFRGYLQALSRSNKKHLFISLQNLSPRRVKGDESKRNQALIALQKEFTDHFRIVVLAQDSDFYKQKGCPEIEKTIEFRKQFLAELFSGKDDSGFYFPEDWKSENAFQKEVEDLFIHVHKIIYEGKDELSKQEKLDFIEIFYAYLAIFLTQYSQADCVNMSCKDAIDRAGKLNSLVLKLVMIMQGKANSSAHKRMHRIWTHGPALFVKSQAIIGERRERLMSPFHIMTDPLVAERIERHNIPYVGQPDGLISRAGDVVVDTADGEERKDNV